MSVTLRLLESTDADAIVALLPDLGYAATADQVVLGTMASQDRAMTRPMSPERETGYAELSAYINFFATVTSGISPSDPSHPCNARIAERFGRSQALQGARPAAHDSIAAPRRRPVAQIRMLDAGLRDAGLITLSEVSRRYGRTYPRILKQGRIADETECHLVAGMLSDSNAAASETERAALQRLFDDFESAVSRHRP